MFRKIFLLSLLTFSFSYAVDEIDIEKRRQEQQDFDNLIKSQNFSVPKSSEDNEQKNLILNVNSINLEGNTIFEDFQIDALLKKYIGKNRDIYALINELENKYIERGYVTAKVGLNTEKSDFNNGNISLFVLEGKIDKVFYDDKENKFKTFITFPILLYHHIFLYTQTSPLLLFLTLRLLAFLKSYIQLYSHFHL